MKTIFLVLVIWNGVGNSTYTHRADMFPSWDTCFAALEAAKIEVAKGGDAEGGMALYCTTEDKERNAGPWMTNGKRHEK